MLVAFLSMVVHQHTQRRIRATAGIQLFLAATARRLRRVGRVLQSYVLSKASAVSMYGYVQVIPYASLLPTHGVRTIVYRTVVVRYAFVHSIQRTAASIFWGTMHRRNDVRYRYR